MYPFMEFVGTAKIFRSTLLNIKYCNSFSSPNHIQVLNKRRAIKNIYKPCSQKNNFATVNWCNHKNERNLTRAVIEQRKKGLLTFCIAFLHVQRGYTGLCMGRKKMSI